ncbi:MAG TPA: ferredoxin [Solirubrobacteraceae bacterium]|nr:ferredoxin [Solirubrobacteraceae bacterium]
MKLCVSEACQGHGRCYTLAPQLLSSDDEGFVTIRAGDPVDVPDDLHDLAEEVEGTCPENAISLID